MSKDLSILHLSLKKEWFDLMVVGKKTTEYREPTDWIIKRLEKDYDVIKFTNGYGKDRPYFICEFKGFEISTKSEVVVFDKAKVNVTKGIYKIYLGKILENG